MFRLVDQSYSGLFSRLSDKVLCSRHSLRIILHISHKVGYMFRLIDQSSSGVFSRLSHEVLCTHWGPSVYTSIKYIKSDQLPKEV